MCSKFGLPAQDRQEVPELLPVLLSRFAVLLPCLRLAILHTKTGRIKSMDLQEHTPSQALCA